MSTPTDICVIGAGGGTGLACVRQALSDGLSVRAVVRNVDKYKFPAETSVVAGDVADELSLERAFSGARTVVFAASTSTWNGADAVDNLGVAASARAAAKVGVEHFILVSSMFVEPQNRFHPIRLLLNNLAKWGIMDAKFKGEQALKSSGIKRYTIVRPGGLRDGAGGMQLVFGQVHYFFIFAFMFHFHSFLTSMFFIYFEKDILQRACLIRNLKLKGQKALLLIDCLNTG